jgi:hypothetical protein
MKEKGFRCQQAVRPFHSDVMSQSGDGADSTLIARYLLV